MAGTQLPTTVVRPSPRSTAAIAPFSRIERHTIFPSKREGGAIHYFQLAFQRLLMGQAVIAFGIAIVLRVGAIDAVDIGGFQHRLGTELGCPQHGSSVRGEERIAGSPCQQHHPPLLDVAQGAAPFVALADLRHAKRRHGSSCQAGFFHRALERERVHHGGEHSHQVASYTG